MGLLRKIIDFILSLLGMKKDDAQEASPPALTAGDKEKIKNQAVSGLEDVEGAENIHVHGTGDNAKVVKSADGADLIEEDGDSLWVNRQDRDVPRASWKDVWGPLANVPQDKRLEEWCVHSREFDELHQGQPLEAEKKLLELGYKSVGEYYRVEATVLKYFATPHGPNLGDCVIDSQEYMSAMMRADARRRDQKQAGFAQANPELLAPVEGVTVELYAQIAARIAQQISQPDLMKLLAANNLDFPTWERASKVWNDRMSKDTTATIAGIYGKAFMQSGQGQYGAAGAAAAATNYNGAAAAGGEPIPFEKLCEIQGAMAAWAKTGQDVNALLKKHFNMVAADWSSASSWWMTQMMADISKFNVYNSKSAEYEKKWAANASTGSDSDIQF